MRERLILPPPKELIIIGLEGGGGMRGGGAYCDWRFTLKNKSKLCFRKFENELTKVNCSLLVPLAIEFHYVSDLDYSFVVEYDI